jgi:hypothetical protein
MSSLQLSQQNTYNPLFNIFSKQQTCNNMVSKPRHSSERQQRRMTPIMTNELTQTNGFNINPVDSNIMFDFSARARNNRDTNGRNASNVFQFTANAQEVVPVVKSKLKLKR